MENAVCETADDSRPVDAVTAAATITSMTTAMTTSAELSTTNPQQCPTIKLTGADIEAPRVVGSHACLQVVTRTIPTSLSTAATSPRVQSLPLLPASVPSKQTRYSVSPSVSPLATSRCGPVKFGYLFKQSSGKWKRKRWNQRWFFLDSDTGALKYFRHASLPEAVPFRQDAHGTMRLKERGTALVVQGDLPHGVPTPFCFTLSDGQQREFVLCADTNDQFREWTCALSMILNPHKASHLGGNAPTTLLHPVVDRSPRQLYHHHHHHNHHHHHHEQSSGSDVRNLSLPLSRSRDGVSAGVSAIMEDTRTVAQTASSMHVPLTNSAQIRGGLLPALFSGVNPLKLSPRLAWLLVLIGNPFIMVIRYGSVEWMAATVLAVNAVVVWVLWFRHELSLGGHPPRNVIITSVNNWSGSTTSLSSGSESSAPSKGHCLRHPEPSSRVATTNAAPSSAGTDVYNQESDGDGGGGGDPDDDEDDDDREPAPTESVAPEIIRGLINGTRAVAGTSVPMHSLLSVISLEELPDIAIPTGCWARISAMRFHVRQGPNYRKTKLKSRSDESLLELAAIDVFRSANKVDNIGQVVDLRSLQNPETPLDLLVINCQVPSYQPSNPLWGEKQGDGDGFNFVTYLTIPPHIRAQLNEDDPGHQAVRLLKNFMQDDSSVRDRFKAIGIVANPSEPHLGRTERHLLETYNGQPILTRPQHRFYRGPGYFEVDVDAHEFNYVARKGLAGVSEHFKNMVVDFGFLLEGQEDLELPEQILGGVRLAKIDVRNTPRMT